jgi:hypothetical protein
MERAGRVRVVMMLPVLLALLFISAAVFASCGGAGDTVTEAPDAGTDEGSRLPPGITSEDLEGLNLEDPGQDAGGSGSGEGEDVTEGSSQPDAPDPRYTSSLSGAQFNIVDITRNGSNQKVIESSQREVMGDYLEIELAVENVGEEVIDLSQYSFRLESPSIEADEYRSYYDDNGYLGKYVSEHVISAVLLDYADLTPVTCKLKKKEVLEGVFLFFDLDPQSIEENAGFSADIANGDAYLVIHKVRGSDYGEEIRMSLAGFAD